MNTLSTITIFPETKEQLKSFQAEIKQEILFSSADPLEVLKRFKYLEKILKFVFNDKEINECFLNEAEKRESKTFIENDCEYSIKEVGTKYDYSQCNDVILDDINQQIKELTKKKSERETLLKSLGNNSIADAETGQELYPPSKTSTTKLCVKI